MQKGEPMIRIEESNPSFESCSDCIYSDDSEEMCILRRCIHAVAQLEERYVPKQPTIEPDPDTISRQADGADLFPDVSEEYRQGYRDGLHDKPEPHWIPVTERLPENGRQVLVYARSVHYALAKYDEMREADGTYKMQWVTFDAWKPFYTIKDVIAWMPLPEPYREGE